MTRVYYEADGDLATLAGKLVAVIGYGSLGRPVALNLRDSGVRVLVGLRDEANRATAEADGLSATTIDDAVRQAQVIVMMLPDEVMPEVYIQRVAPHLKRGDALVFASAYNVAYGFIEAPPYVDVCLVAPRTLGAAVRERYLQGQGFISFVAVAQDTSRSAWGVVLALALALGSLRAGAVEISFEREAELDLFVQQAIVPAVFQLLVGAADLLLDAGYPAEAVFADLYLAGELTDLLAAARSYGLLGALERSSPTHQYGTFTRLERYRDLRLDRLMERTLGEVQSSDFAREWGKEYSDGSPRLPKLRRALHALELWPWEQQALDNLTDAADGHEENFTPHDGEIGL